MGHSLADAFKQTIIQGLKRKSLTTCSRWASACRVMGKPCPGLYSFEHTPWTREMHDSEAYKNIGQKSAQAGYSETVLNRTLYKIDIERVDCMYILPSMTPDATRFSASRFDPALEMSEHLSGLFSNVKNVGHKRAGTSNLYLGGCNSRSGLKSVPVGFLVFDEFDEMNMDLIPLAYERLSGQFKKQIWEISTPTSPNTCINAEYNTSTMEHFFFDCPHCGREMDLSIDNLVVTADDLRSSDIIKSHIICLACKMPISQEEKHETLLKTGRWTPTAINADPNVRGFYVNQLYSRTISPVDLARSYLAAKIDPASEQEFFNSKLGLPHVVDGAEVTVDCFPELIKKHKRGEPQVANSFVTMGVDPGKLLHYVVEQWYVPPSGWGKDLNVSAVCKVLDIGTKLKFEELDDLMRRYQVRMCVCDIQPESRKAYEFAERFSGYVKLCCYLDNDNPKAIKIDDPNKSIRILANRTSWMDMALSRFFNKTIHLPYDTPEDFKNHIMNVKRVYQKDRHGNPIGRYNHAGPDHYAHARTYSEIALPLGAAFCNNKTIDTYL